MNKQDLDKVQTLVNNTTVYETDLDQYHQVEMWEEAGKYGDCEDFAIKKLRMLLKMGWPIAKLRLAICWVGEKAPDTGHAVLLAELDNRIYVLDNRYDWVYEPTENPEYVWNSCQRIGGVKEWVTCRSVFSRFYPED